MCSYIVKQICNNFSSLSHLGITGFGSFISITIQYIYINTEKIQGRTNNDCQNSTTIQHIEAYAGYPIKDLLE